MKEKLQQGYVLKTKDNDYALVLKVEGSAYIQDAFDGRWSTQSHNNPKEPVVHLWTGLFYRKHSLSDIDQMYEEIIAPDNKEFIKTLNMINK